MAEPTRRAVLFSVLAAPRAVTDIARDLPVSRPAVSQHLKVLSEAGLVEVRKSGRERLYGVRREGLARLRRELDDFWRGTLAGLKQVAEQTYQSPDEHEGTLR